MAEFEKVFAFRLVHTPYNYSAQIAFNNVKKVSVSITCFCQRGLRGWITVVYVSCISFTDFPVTPNLVTGKFL